MQANHHIAAQGGIQETEGSREELLRTHPPASNPPMSLSARNKLKGAVEEVLLGTVMAHIVVRVGENLIESAITRRSADELQLKKGDTVYAIVKSTEVMIQKD